MKVSIITLPFRKTYLIPPVYDAIFAQTHKDLEVIAVINDPADGSKEVLQRDYPKVKIIEPGANLFFDKGVNLGVRNSTGEFIQLVNDDLLLEPNYIEEMLKAFADSKVAAASGKLLRYNFETKERSKIIDTTGIIMSASGRARDRGQLQEDRGQFDDQKDVFGVSGAGPMYRRSALEKVKFEQEYFDEDFVMYWEDVDLSWRFNNAGFKNVYVPTAVAYHGRTAGQAEGGYLHILKFIKHHQKLSPQILRWNYKNHILMYIKNAKHIWHPAFVGREIAMLGYILVFEPGTLKVLPELFRQIPKIWAKRKAAPVGTA
ncbi:MAG: glycosyltransferase family 2 protein [Candidatus Doudnabacteria bacterium]